MDEADERRKTPNGPWRRRALGTGEIARASLGVDDVRRALPAGSVLVSFVQFNRSAPACRRNGWRRRRRLPLRPAPPAECRAGPAGYGGDHRALVSAFRIEASGTRLLSGGDPQPPRTSITALAMRSARRSGIRLPRTSRDATRIFVIPDGAIGLVPIAALPAGASSYLLDNRRRSTTCRQNGISWPSPYPCRPAPGECWPSADRPSATRLCCCRAGLSGIHACCRDCISGCTGVGLAARAFRACSSRLSLARSNEVQAISRLWAARRGAVPARLLVGPDARETTFKHSPTSTACSTWRPTGSFLSDACGAKAAAGTRGVGGLTATAGSRREPAASLGPRPTAQTAAPQPAPRVTTASSPGGGRRPGPERGGWACSLRVIPA